MGNYRHRGVTKITAVLLSVLLIFTWLPIQAMGQGAEQEIHGNSGVGFSGAVAGDQSASRLSVGLSEGMFMFFADSLSQGPQTLQEFEELITVFELTTSADDVRSGVFREIALAISTTSDRVDDTDIRLQPGDLKVRISLPEGMASQVQIGTYSDFTVKAGGEDSEEDLDEDPLRDYLWLVFDKREIDTETIRASFNVLMAPNKVTAHGQEDTIEAVAYFQDEPSAHTSGLQTTAIVDQFEWVDNTAYIRDADSSSEYNNGKTFYASQAYPTFDNFAFVYRVSEKHYDYGNAYAQAVEIYDPIEIDLFSDGPDAGQPKLLLRPEDIQLPADVAGNQTQYKLTYKLEYDPVDDVVEIEGVEYLLRFGLRMVFESADGQPPTSQLTIMPSMHVVKFIGASLHPSLRGEQAEFQMKSVATVSGNATPAYAVQLEGRAPGTEPVDFGEGSKLVVNFYSRPGIEDPLLTKENGIEKYISGTKQSIITEPTTLWPGETVDFGLYSFENVQLNNMESFVVIDDGFDPEQMSPISLNLGTYVRTDYETPQWFDNHPFTVYAYYQEAPDTRVQLAQYTVGKSSSNIVDLVPASQQGMGKVVRVEIDYGPVPAGFRAVTAPTITFQVYYDPETAPDEEGKRYYENGATLSYRYMQQDYSAEDTMGVYVKNPYVVTPGESENKDVTNLTAEQEGNRLPGEGAHVGDILEFTISVTNNTNRDIDQIKVEDKFTSNIAPYSATDDQDNPADFMLDPAKTSGGNFRVVDVDIDENSMVVTLESDVAIRPGQTVYFRYTMQVQDAANKEEKVNNSFSAYGALKAKSPGLYPYPLWQWMDSGRYGSTSGTGGFGNEKPVVSVEKSVRAVNEDPSITSFANGDEVEFIIVISREDDGSSGKPLTLASIYDSWSTNLLANMPADKIDISLEYIPASGVAQELAYNYTSTGSNRFHLIMQTPLEMQAGDVITLKYTGEIAVSAYQEIDNTVRAQFVETYSSAGSSSNGYEIKSGTSISLINGTSAQSAVGHNVTIKAYVDREMHINVRKLARNTTNPGGSGHLLSVVELNGRGRKHCGRRYDIFITNTSSEDLVINTLVDYLPAYETITSDITITYPSFDGGAVEKATLVPEVINYTETDKYGNEVPYQKIVIQDFSTSASQSNQQLVIPANNMSGSLDDSAIKIGTANNYNAPKYAYWISYTVDYEENRISAIQDYYKAGLLSYDDKNTVALYIDGDPSPEHVNLLSSYGFYTEDNGDWDDDSSSRYRLQAEAEVETLVARIMPTIQINAQNLYFNSATDTYTMTPYNYGTDTVLAGNEVAWAVRMSNKNYSDTLISEETILAIVLPEGMELISYLSVSGKESQTPLANTNIHVKEVGRDWLDEQQIIYLQLVHDKGDLSDTACWLRTTTGESYTGDFEAKAYVIPRNPTDENGLVTDLQVFLDSDYTNNTVEGTPVWRSGIENPLLPGEVHMVEDTSVVRLTNKFGAESRKTVTDENSQTTNSNLSAPRLIQLEDSETQFRYTLEVANHSIGNVAYENLVIIDHLPQPQDTLLVRGSNRGSNTGVQLLGGDGTPAIAVYLMLDDPSEQPKPLTAGEHYEIEYSATMDISYTMGDWKLNDTPENGNWQLSLPANQVRSFRITLLQPLEAGYGIKVAFDAQLEQDSLRELVSIAYNSFGYAFMTQDSGGRFPALVEPFPVGVKVEKESVELVIRKTLDVDTQNPPDREFTFQVTGRDTNGGEQYSEQLTVMVEQDGNDWKGEARITGLHPDLEYSIEETGLSQEYNSPVIVRRTEEQDGTTVFVFDVKNTLKDDSVDTVDLLVRKLLDINSGDPPHRAFSFEVTGRDENGVVGYVNQFTISVENNGAGWRGEETLRGLDPDLAYSVSETNLPGFYDTPVIVRSTETQDGTKVFVFEVTNRLKEEGGDDEEGSVQLKKVGANGGAALKGAEFQLFTSDGTQVGDTLTTDGKGLITVKGLSAGDYYFIEKTAPEGYILDTTKHEFSILAGGGDTVETVLLEVENHPVDDPKDPDPKDPDPKDPSDPKDPPDSKDPGTDKPDEHDKPGRDRPGREFPVGDNPRIVDEDIPLAEILLSLIEDQDIPLGDLPFTGTSAMAGLAMALGGASLLTICTLTATKKKK